MAAGKTTLARALGARLTWRTEDIDELIEAREHRSIADIFGQQGEAYFRAIERDILLQLVPLRYAVVATGGGTFVDPDNRAMTQSRRRIDLARRPVRPYRRTPAAKWAAPACHGSEDAGTALRDAKRRLPARASSARRQPLACRRADRTSVGLAGLLTQVEGRRFGAEPTSPSTDNPRRLTLSRRLTHVCVR